MLINLVGMTAMTQFLEGEGISCAFVATKIDKLKKSELSRSLGQLIEGYALESSGIIPFSAVTGVGKRDVWRAIRAGILADDPLCDAPDE